MKITAALVLLLLPAVSTAAESRVAKTAARFLGVPYKLGPLGEGPGGEYDRGPLMNVKEFDCTTFVEHVMAFALSADAGGVSATLQKIRYKNGVVGYETRNHFTEADWVPNNVAAGFLRDVTREIGGAKTMTASKTVRKAAWYAQKKASDLRGFDGDTAEDREARAKRWRALGAGFADQTVSLDYLPAADLPELLASIPSGTVANVVREPRDDKETMISHQLFIVDGPAGKLVRHAASKKEVLDVPALDYFKVYAGSDWKFLGLNLNEVVLPGSK